MLAFSVATYKNIYLPMDIHDIVHLHYVAMNSHGENPSIITHTAARFLFSSFTRYGLDHEKFDEICIRKPILAMGPKVKQGYASLAIVVSQTLLPLH